MTGQTNTFEVENPYVYWRTAQEYEQAGDPRGAEIGYKAAVLAADHLPLNEYRRNFHEELNKHLSVPGYRTPPNIGPEELKIAYAELLTLPLAARVRLALFFIRQTMTAEAQEMCTDALSLKIDDWIQTQESYLELKRELEGAFRSIQGARRPATTTGRQRTIGQQMLDKARPTPSSYNLPDITELWNDHVSASRSAAASAGLSGDDDGPLSLDSRALLDAMYHCLKRFIDDISQDERKRLGIVATQPELSEKFYRFRASTAVSSLSVRASESQVEVFVVSTRELLNLADIESEYCLRTAFVLKSISGKRVWTCDKFPIYADDMRVNVRTAFKELMQQCSAFLDSNEEPMALRDTHGLIKQLSELSQQRTNLAEKIVYQQEMVQNRIARDIHDSVIADILALKRAYEVRAVSDQQVLGSLEDVSQRLRNICSDLAPRDLQDWGLRTVVTDMVGTARQRLNIAGQAVIAASLPELPYQVSLHVYRIIQESLNNMEKHARASEFQVELTMENGIFTATVQDNGVGFDPGRKDLRKAAQGGMGLDSIRERTELIRCFFPAELWINTQPGHGTKTVLQINTSSAK